MINEEIYEDDGGIEEEDNFEAEDVKEVIEIEEELNISKHKESGKHSLSYDTIFKGKQFEVLDEFSDISNTIFFNETFDIDRGSNFFTETIDNERYVREKLVKEEVYKVLLHDTDLNFLNSRRKPSRSDFNRYYTILHKKLEKNNFTNIELFNELAYYFSDNLFNMFKLLDKKWRNILISELQNHIGKIDTSKNKDVIAKNINLGAEIEFQYIDEYSNEMKTITGVVEELDYDLDEYQVNSYEAIYIIGIKNVTKILNNTKFKYNLNKLNNIDFL
jgi:hypothetical protein